MSKRTKKTPEKGNAPTGNTKSKVFAIGLVLIIVAIVTITLFTLRRGADIENLPFVDLSGLEPQVVERIQELTVQVNSEPQNAARWGRLGMSLFAHDFKQESLACFREAWALEPKDFRWSYYHGFAQQDIGDPESLIWYERAAASDPGYAPVHVRMGDIYLDQQNHQMATAAYNRALSLNDALSHAYYGLARAATETGNKAVAMEHLRKAIEVNPQHREPVVLLVTLLKQTGQGVKAQDLERSVERLPVGLQMFEPAVRDMLHEGVSYYWFTLRGRDYLRGKKYAEAAAELERALKIKADAATSNDVGYCYLRLRQPKAALPFLQVAAAMAPDSAQYLADYGQALVLTGDSTGVEKMFEAFKSNPTNVNVVTTLSDYYRRVNNWRLAVNVYRRALMGDSKRYLFRYNAAWFMAVAPQKEARSPREALDIVLRMLNDPAVEQSEVYELYSVVYAANGRFQQAKQYSQRAIQRASQLGNKRLQQILLQRHRFFEEGRAWDLGAS